jgi:hypothetical protein
VRNIDLSAEDAPRSRVAVLQTYLASLLYLREEARRDGLEPLANIIWNAIAAVETWLDSGESGVNSREVLDSPLCHSLDFLLKWLALPPAKQREVTGLIASQNGVPPAGLSSRPVARLSKRTAK